MGVEARKVPWEGFEVQSVREAVGRRLARKEAAAFQSWRGPPVSASALAAIFSHASAISFMRAFTLSLGAGSACSKHLLASKWYSLARSNDVLL